VLRFLGNALGNGRPNGA